MNKKSSNSKLNNISNNMLEEIDKFFDQQIYYNQPKKIKKKSMESNLQPNLNLTPNIDNINKFIFQLQLQPSAASETNA